MAPASVLTLLLGVLCFCKARLTPRISFTLGGPGRTFTQFSDSTLRNTTTLLLSDDEATLHVGAEDAVFSLDVSQPGVMTLGRKLDWSPSPSDLGNCSMKGKEKADCSNFIRVLHFLNSTHMYACGTFAFSPRCIYIDLKTFSVATGPSGRPDDGRGRCPYDPFQRNTAVVVDGELYTGTVADYRGNRPVISRHLSQGTRIDLKLDDTLGWLEDPTFISSTFVPSEGKVYFFFSEVGKEYDFIEKFIVSRVAQVCTSDIGGQRTLQRRWTTFAKAQLLCQSQNELPYNVIQDIVPLPSEGGSEDETLFYGIFSSQWSTTSGQSAVCAFKLGDIKSVFAGNYKVLNRDTQRWSTRSQEKVANPGECGLHNASDNTLRFVKENFLADESVQPVGRGLALVSPDQHYSKILAQRIRVASGRNYTVLFLLTESGFIHKTVLLDKGPHIIEEIQVFKHPQSVTSFLLSVTKGVLFVGSPEGVSQVPVFNCSFYWSCAQCVLARDPFCGWDHSHRACVRVSQHQGNLGQDVEEGNVPKMCNVSGVSPRSRSTQKGHPTDEPVHVSLNEVVKLPCPKISQLASVDWKRPDGNLSLDLYMQLDDGSLHFLASSLTLGSYQCYSVENGYSQALAAFSVCQRTGVAAAATTTLKAARPTHARIRPTVEAKRPAMTPPRGLQPETAATATTPVKTTTLWRQTTATFRRETRNLIPADRIGRVETGWSFGREQLLLSNGRTYYKELVAVSIMLALTLSVLLLVTLYGLRYRCRGRTNPHVCPGTDSDTARPPEEDPLREAQQAELPAAAHNGTPKGSNGHLPNIPI